MNQQEQIRLQGQVFLCQKDLSPILMGAIKIDNTSLTKQLIAAGADVNYAENNTSVIWSAVLADKLDQVQILIENKADLGVTWSGKKLLAYAITNQKFDLVKLLIDGGIEYTAEKLKEEQILNLALNKSSKIFKLLLAKWPILDVIEHMPPGYCSILYNVSYYLKDPEIIQMLFDIGVNPNIKNNTEHGSTPLINACECNEIEIVKLFLKHPAIDINITNNRGINALKAAVGHTEIIQLLKEHMVTPSNKIFNKDGKEYVIPIEKKPLFNVEILCTNVPVPLTITIPQNAPLPCVVWNPTAETWNKEVITYDTSFTIEVIDKQAICHNHPELGFIKFDQLTMPDGTVRTHADLYQ